MRKFCLALTALGNLTLVFAPVGAVKASSIGGNPPAHWDCPNGVTLHLGGGGGNRQMALDAANRYNSWRAEQAQPGGNGTGRQAWPVITDVYYGAWDGIARSNIPCWIDMDEVHRPGWAYAGYSQMSIRSNSGHTIGCGITMNGALWGGGGFNDAYTMTQELMHCMGLGHTFEDPGSVMSYHYQRIGLVYSDLSTMSHVLYPQGGHH